MATFYNTKPPNKKGPKYIWSERLLERKVMIHALNSFCPTTGVPCLNHRSWALMHYAEGITYTSCSRETTKLFSSYCGRTDSICYTNIWSF